MTSLSLGNELAYYYGRPSAYIGCVGVGKILELQLDLLRKVSVHVRNALLWNMTHVACTVGDYAAFFCSWRCSYRLFFAP